MGGCVDGWMHLWLDGWMYSLVNSLTLLGSLLGRLTKGWIGKWTVNLGVRRLQLTGSPLSTGQFEYKAASASMLQMQRLPVDYAKRGGIFKLDTHQRWCGCCALYTTVLIEDGKRTQAWKV